MGTRWGWRQEPKKEVWRPPGNKEPVEERWKLQWKILISLLSVSRTWWITEQEGIGPRNSLSHMLWKNRRRKQAKEGRTKEGQCWLERSWKVRTFSQTRDTSRAVTCRARKSCPPHSQPPVYPLSWVAGLYFLIQYLPIHFDHQYRCLSHTLLKKIVPLPPLESWILEMLVGSLLSKHSGIEQWGSIREATQDWRQSADPPGSGQLTQPGFIS